MWSRALVQQVGGFDESLRYLFDINLYAALIARGERLPRARAPGRRLPLPRDEQDGRRGERCSRAEWDIIRARYMTSLSPLDRLRASHRIGLLKAQALMVDRRRHSAADAGKDGGGGARRLRACGAPTSRRAAHARRRVDALRRLARRLSGRPARSASRHFACTGLGRERRGFETFTRELCGGAAAEPRSTMRCSRVGATGMCRVSAWSPTCRALARRARLGALLGRDPYFIEQGSFFLGYLPSLVAPPARPRVLRRPQPRERALALASQRTGARWRLLFYNGGNTTMPFTRCDHVQLLTPARDGRGCSRAASGRSGLTAAPAWRDFAAARGARPTPVDARGAPRRAPVALGLPADGEILLSVGQLDRPIKRTHLLDRSGGRAAGRRGRSCCWSGADGPDGAGLCALAPRNDSAMRWRWRSLPRERMPLVYAAADALALLSHGEGFGLAYVESLGAGLPLLVHDDATTRVCGGRRGAAPSRSATRGPRTSRRRRCFCSRSRPMRRASARARARRDVRARFALGGAAPQYVAMFHRARRARAPRHDRLGRAVPGRW
jgi:hypothetical protein